MKQLRGLASGVIAAGVSLGILGIGQANSLPLNVASLCSQHGVAVTADSSSPVMPKTQALTIAGHQPLWNSHSAISAFYQRVSIPVLHMSNVPAWIIYNPSTPDPVPVPALGNNTSTVYSNQSATEVVVIDAANGTILTTFGVATIPTTGS